MAAAHPDVSRVELGDAVIAPGFVDVHCHLEWALAGGLAPGGEFGRWLAVFLAAIATAEPGFTVAAADLGALLAARAGTTTLWDSGPSGAGAVAMHRIGLSGISCIEAFGAGGPESVDATLARLRDGLARTTDAVMGDTVRIGIAPHSPYTVGPALWAGIAAARDLGTRPWTTHLAESPAELVAITTGRGTIAEALSARGVRPAQWGGVGGAGVVERVAADGGLPRHMVAAHCVQLVPGEPELLAARGVAVAHCPISNAKLGCGVAPLPALLEAGVRVGLGTDSPASAGSYDLRAEARACGLVHQAGGAELRPRDLVRLMTLGGAEAMGIQDEVGTIDPGKRADLVAIAPPPQLVGGDPHLVVLDGGARIRGVWARGVAVVRDGEVAGVDVERILSRAAEARASVC